MSFGLRKNNLVKFSNGKTYPVKVNLTNKKSMKNTMRSTSWITEEIIKLFNKDK